MATLTVQELPANGVDLGDITFTAADVAGDEWANTGRDLVIVQFGATPSGNVQVEGVPSADSGRDGTVTFTAGANETHIGGPYKPRNFNTGGVTQLTYPGGVTDINVAIVRFTLG